MALDAMRWRGRPTQYLGRNGYFKCKGFELKRLVTSDPGWSTDVIRIHPITSKGMLGRCFIEIPVSQLKRFTKLLNLTKKMSGV